MVVSRLNFQLILYVGILIVGGLALMGCQGDNSAQEADAVPTAPTTVHAVNTLPPTWTPAAGRDVQAAQFTSTPSATRTTMPTFTPTASATPTPEDQVEILGQPTAEYGSVVYAFESTELWDVLACDLVVSYTLDMSRYTPRGGTQWSSVGVTGNAQGWLGSGAPEAAQTDDQHEDRDDQFLLMAPGQRGEDSYNALKPDTLVQPPIGNPQMNTGIWFDRDGIAPEEATQWGHINGITYNTRGIYQVQLTFHAIDRYFGTMFATVNGQQTGFFEAQKHGKPEYLPVGKSFTGDSLSGVRVFATAGSPEVQIADLSVIGCLYKLYVEIDIQSDEGTNCFNGTSGVIPVVIFGDVTFDVSQIDPATLRLEQLRLNLNDSSHMSSDYVNDDEYLDLVLQFEHSGTLGTAGQTYATLTGALRDFTPLEGVDDVCIGP